MALPTLDSDHAYVLNRHNGQELYALAETESNRIASLTKTFTIGKLVREFYGTREAMEATSVTVTADDEAIGGSGDSALEEGDIWDVFRLCQAAWLPSSNEAAHALGRVVATNNYGSTGTSAEIQLDFVAEMNVQAAASGMSGTTYTTSHGAPVAEGLETSTAKDQAILLDQVVDWPAFRDILTDQSPNFDIIRNGQTFNRGLSTSLTIVNDTGVIGAKGGAGGGNHLETLWQAPNGNEIIIVTLSGGVSEREADHRAIIAQLPIDYPYLAGPTGTTIP